MKKQSPLQSVTADSGQKRLYSLTGIINIGLVTLILSIFVLAVTTYSKLKSFEESLVLMTDESLPTVVHSGELYL
jgi:flagellar biosynthesis protein FlhB